MARTAGWTVEQLATLPDDQRPEIVRDRLEWLPEGASEPLVIDVPVLFAEVGAG